MVKLDYQRLKTIRLEQDVTQKELAQSTGVSLSTAYSMLRGSVAVPIRQQSYLPSVGWGLLFCV